MGKIKKFFKNVGTDIEFSYLRSRVRAIDRKNARDAKKEAKKQNKEKGERLSPVALLILFSS